MKLFFGRLTLAHFRSFKKAVVFDLADLPNGLIYVRGKNRTTDALGSNGAGKSTIFDALTWCIYGRSVAGLRNPDIEPWSGSGSPDVSFEFWITDDINDDPHVIRRSMKPNRLLLDDKEVGQETIDRTLGLSLPIFLNTIVMGQGRPLFFDLPPREKLNLFVDVLELDRWDERSKKASDESSALAGEEAGLTRDIENYKKQQELVAADLKQMQTRSAAWEEERSVKLSQADEQIKDLDRKLENIQHERDTADLAYDGANTELTALKTNIEVLRNLIRDQRASISELKRKEADLAEKIAAAQKELKELKNEHCPTCRQPIHSAKAMNDLKEKIGDRITNLQSEQKPKTLAKLEAKYEENQSVLDRSVEAAKVFETKLEEAWEVLARLQPKAAEWEAQRTMWKKAKEEKGDDANPFSDQIMGLRTRTRKIKTTIEETERRANLVNRKLERSRFWIKGFKDIRLYIVDEILQELELTANAMMDEFGLTGWSIRFEVEKETKSGTITRELNVVVLSPENDKAVRWECWSGGEGQRLRVIGALALAEVLLNHAGVIPNVEVLDEPTTWLSVEGSRDLVDALADRGKRLKRKILYVDHISVESSRFASIVSVVKTAKGSSIKVTQNG